MKQCMYSDSFSVNMNQQFPLLFLDGAGTMAIQVSKKSKQALNKSTT